MIFPKIPKLKLQKAGTWQQKASIDSVVSEKVLIEIRLQEVRLFYFLREMVFALKELLLQYDANSVLF